MVLSIVLRCPRKASLPVSIRPAQSAATQSLSPRPVKSLVITRILLEWVMDTCSITGSSLPSIFQFILCSGVASSSLGYQVRGTEIVRPSFRDTLKAESVNETSATLSSAPSAKIPMPSLQELLLVLHYDAI